MYETLNVNEFGTEYTATWTPTEVSANYVFRVTATDDSNDETQVDVNFSVDVINSVSTLNEAQVKLFPNPSTSEFTLSLEGVGNYEVYVYSINGQLLSSDKVLGGAQYRFGANLSQGLYLVKVVSEEGNYQSRIIKQ